MLNDVAARVVEVLTRAESLFAPPADAASAAAAADRLGQAADANRALGGRTSELSGSAASAHRQLVEASAERLGAAAQADSRLAAQLRAAADKHYSGRTQAQHLRTDAAAVFDRLAPLSGTPAGEVATLKALRTRVARMQQLLSEHKDRAADAAAQIRDIDYRR